MICRRCKKEVPDRIFGYCKECAEELGADKKINPFNKSLIDLLPEERMKGSESEMKRCFPKNHLYELGQNVMLKKVKEVLGKCELDEDKIKTLLKVEIPKGRTEYSSYITRFYKPMAEKLVKVITQNARVKKGE